MGESSPNADAVIRSLGKYVLIEKLGEGYLGSVYRGFDQDQGKPVVVRILSEDIKWNADIKRPFFHICKVVAGLEHPNIAAIFDVGKKVQSPYIVMESLGSGNLNALIKKKPAMSAEAKLSIMIQVAEGLSHAHKKNILHHDLKPSKIHVLPDGSVKIRDFAIAHILARHLPRPTVRSEMPIYLSPEQIQNKDTDERSDIFSAGTIFCELLTYLHPFHNPNDRKALDNVLRDETIPTFEQFPDVPPGFWSILKACLARDPEDRYQSADRLLIACKDLRKSLSEDSRFMLAELYASQNALKKAAAQPNSSESTLKLLRDIQELSQGDKKPDCVSLDRLMTALIEQYPIIQAAAYNQDTIDPLPDNATLKSELAEQMELTEESVQSEEPNKGSGRLETGPEPIENLPPKQQHSPMAWNVESGQDIKADIAAKEDMEVQPRLIELHRNIAAYISYFSSKLKACYRTIPRSPYRSAAMLIAILVVTAAGFIFFETEVPARIGNAWGTIPPKSHANESTTVLQNGSGNAEERIQDLPSKKNPINEMVDTTLKENGVQKTQSSSLKRERIQASVEEKKRREQERAARMQKEEEWNVKLTRFFRSGNYGGAGDALNLWLEENPESLRAKEFNAKLNEIQRGLSSYSAAMSQNRYEDALNALEIAEANNPIDPIFATFRQQVEARKASARAVLTVRRLGAEGELFFDGRPIGAKGEIINERIPIGNHIVSIESDGNLIASRDQKYIEGQEVTLIYDLAGLMLRPMVEADLELLALRKKMDKIHRFDADHKHGLFRGSCRGVLLVGYYNFEYKPFSGQHEFRIPFKLLKISKIDGRSIEFSFVSDNKNFQSFEFQYDDSAERFVQIWRDLKALPQ